MKSVIVTLSLTGLLAFSACADDATNALNNANNALTSSLTTAQGKVDSAAASARATAKAQGIIDKAKSYVADKKYQPALDTLAKLKNMKLTTEQQTMVDGLKTQIKTLMAGSTTGSAVGGLIK